LTNCKLSPADDEAFSFGQKPSALGVQCNFNFSEQRVPMRLTGYPAEPLVSYQINRQLSGWNVPPLVIRAFGAHCQHRT
jgi:hypothetical protein